MSTYDLAERGYGFKKAEAYINVLARKGKALTMNLKNKRQELDFILLTLSSLTECAASSPSGI